MNHLVTFLFFSLIPITLFSQSQKINEASVFTEYLSEAGDTAFHYNITFWAKFSDTTGFDKVNCRLGGIDNDSSIINTTFPLNSPPQGVTAFWNDSALFIEFGQTLIPLSYRAKLSLIDISNSVIETTEF